MYDNFEVITTDSKEKHDEMFQDLKNHRGENKMQKNTKVEVIKVEGHSPTLIFVGRFGATDFPIGDPNRFVARVFGHYLNAMKG